MWQLAAATAATPPAATTRRSTSRGDPRITFRYYFLGYTVSPADASARYRNTDPNRKYLSPFANNQGGKKGYEGNVFWSKGTEFLIRIQFSLQEPKIRFLSTALVRSSSSESGSMLSELFVLVRNQRKSTWQRKNVLTNISTVAAGGFRFARIFKSRDESEDFHD